MFLLHGILRAVLQIESQYGYSYQSLHRVTPNIQLTQSTTLTQTSSCKFSPSDSTFNPSNLNNLHLWISYNHKWFPPRPSIVRSYRLLPPIHFPIRFLFMILDIHLSFSNVRQVIPTYHRFQFLFCWYLFSHLVWYDSLCPTFLS